MRSGLLPEALESAVRAVDLYRSSDVWHWRFQLLRAEILLARSKFPEARAILALAMPRMPGMEALQARRRYLEGYALSRESRWGEAIRVLEEAAAAAAAAGSGETERASRLAQGQACISDGRIDEGERLSRALIRASEASGDSYHRGAALLNLGTVYIRRSRYESAIPFSEEAAAVGRRCGSALLEYSALGNLADCRARMGEYEQSLEARRQSTAVFERGGALRLLLQSLGESGTTYLLAEKPDLAVADLRRALALASQTRLEEDKAEWSTTLASALIETGQLEEAGRLNAEAIASFRDRKDQSGLIGARLNAARLLAARGESDRAHQAFSDVLADAGTDSETLRETHAGLARLERSRGRRAEASAHYARAIAIIELARVGLERQESAITFQASVNRIYREYVDLLIERGMDEEALEIADSGRARALSDRLGERPPPRRPLRRRWLMDLARRDRLAFLVYWTGRARSHVWVITANAFRRIPLGAEGPLRNLAIAYRNSLESTTRDPLAGSGPGEDLYHQVLEPVIGLLKGVGQVVVVPDGPLHSINLETLPVPGPRPHYWIEETAVRVVPSLAVLETAARQAPAGARRVLLIGDPEPADPQFPRLPNAAGEIAAVRSFSPGDRRELTGAQATPEAYFESRPGQYDWIHFTAHARASAASPLDSAVILSRGRAGYTLTAWDVMRTPIHAELVTISACRGAGARAFSGEGMVGFAWAFLKAGASSVIAGLWDVDDRATRILMEHMYQDLAGRQAPASALRNAKLALLASGGSYANPFYWGPFQIYTRGLR